MTNNISSNTSSVTSSPQPQTNQRWPTFLEMLQRLHQEGIYIHPEHLAEFLLFHGLPVNLCYVPKHLKSKAAFINKNYQGDMADIIEEPDDVASQFPWLNQN